MGRRRKGIPLHGWLVIDKTPDMSSNAVVGAVQRITNAAKVGHAGTLDPLATGLLPLALGEATKTVSYVMDGTKIYRFALRFGEERTTDDAEGEVTETSDVRPSDDEILAVLGDFIGEIEQIPPIFSAIKINGERAYKLARADEAVEMKPRTVRIDDLRLIERPDADHAVFEATCGKGTYMRSLARDLARKLGSCGHIRDLRRIAVGPFTESDAISLEKLESLGHSAPLDDILLPVETALDDIPALALTEAEASRMRHGQGISVLEVARRTPLKGLEQGDVVLAMASGKAVALARIAGGEVRPLRVLNL